MSLAKSLIITSHFQILDNLYLKNLTANSNDIYNYYINMRPCLPHAIRKPEVNAEEFFMTVFISPCSSSMSAFAIQTVKLLLHSLYSLDAEGRGEGGHSLTSNGR